MNHRIGTIIAIALSCLTGFIALGETLRPEAAGKYSVLALGTRADVTTWSSGVEKLGFGEGYVVAKQSPSLDELATFFGRSDDWIFIGGHFQDYLYNKLENPDVKVKFAVDRVVIEVGGETRELTKGSGFKQDKAKVIFWGGCSVHLDPERVKVMRALFGGQAVMVGWKGKTGWQIVDINCGGKGDGQTTQTDHFFTKMNASTDAGSVRKAWLESADNIEWGKGVRKQFSVIEADGQEWLLKGDARGGGLVKGVKY